MKGPTTIASLNKLEARGRDRRDENKKDACKINVYLTREGQKFYRKVIPTENGHCMSTLTGDEQENFRDVIKRIRNTIAGT
ncbi:MAG: hypothetical protein CFH41_02496 [Alphaproteobacteria bacterium MarineAlpha11_Bin1]|nr:MAG: hypothetical protein CFH41_02496 [Alphaproteobacteria bacterium MarineAlpha11_Bin1]|tara:strand:- start:5227 stop:5469 length:243 start_codon:yes stop_codon:yes gene_type:complete